MGTSWESTKKEFESVNDEVRSIYGLSPVERKETVKPGYPWLLFAVIFFLVSFTTLSGDSRKKNKQHEIFQQE